MAAVTVRGEQGSGQSPAPQRGSELTGGGQEGLGQGRRLGNSTGGNGGEQPAEASGAAAKPHVPPGLLCAGA